MPNSMSFREFNILNTPRQLVTISTEKLLLATLCSTHALKRSIQSLTNSKKFRLQQKVLIVNQEGLIAKMHTSSMCRLCHHQLQILLQNLNKWSIAAMKFPMSKALELLMYQSKTPLTWWSSRLGFMVGQQALQHHQLTSVPSVSYTHLRAHET